MSIYATLWTLKFPCEGDATLGCDWVTVQAQAVPAHIGTPTPGHGYEGGDPYAGFLPPPVAVNAQGEAPHDRAVVFVTEHSLKGTERRPQEHAAPLLVLTGEEWAQPIIARGVRPEFELERILPGSDPEDLDSDPIVESNDLKDAGDSSGARRILMELCQADLRCLDAHAHLGNLVFDYSPKDALRHYEVGVRIGELSIGTDFDGLLPWGYIDNRPFLRCLNGFGLCLWRLNRFADAERVLDRMLWLNPTDNQGVRFLIDEVRARKPWTGDQEKE